VLIVKVFLFSLLKFVCLPTLFGFQLSRLLAMFYKLTANNTLCAANDNSLRNASEALFSLIQIGQVGEFLVL
jgi:hypothetical protein